MKDLASSLRKIVQVHFPPLSFHTFAQRIEPFLTAQTLVRVFYFFLLSASIGIFARWDLSLAPQAEVSPMWPVQWIRFVEFPFAIASIGIFFILSSLFASFFPERRIARVLAFLGVLEFVSFYASMMKLDIDWYVWVVAAFLLIFLPDGWRRPAEFSVIERQKFLFVFWGCQTFLLLTYTMSGIGKVYFAIAQFLHGEVNVFSPHAGALHIADRLIVTGSTSALGPWIIDHYWLAWPFMVWTVYILFFSFWVAFRPSVHRIWGLGLIVFHIAPYLTINIGFSAHIFLIALLFLNSPFQQPRTSWREVVLDLPLLGWISGVFARKSWKRTRS